jgi:hypothetical protein
VRDDDQTDDDDDPVTDELGDAELDEDELDEDDLESDDLEDEDLELTDDDDSIVVVAEDEEDDEALDLEEELHPDDVEEPLDVLLLERTASTAIDEDEDEIEDEEEDVEAEDRAEGGGRILPRRPGEFVCRSCFLVKHPSQLADADRQLCRDCV